MDTQYKLAIWGIIELQKYCCNMRTYSFEPTLWRPYLPNKPVRVEGAHVEGTTNFVTYQYSAEAGTITTGFELGMTKHRDEKGNYSFDILGTLEQDLYFSWRRRWGEIKKTLDQLTFPIVTTPTGTGQGGQNESSSENKNEFKITQNAPISMAALLAGKVTELEGDWTPPVR